MELLKEHFGMLIAILTVIGTVAGWLITYGMLVARVKRIEEDVRALCKKDGERLPDGRDMYVYTSRCDAQEAKVDNQFNQLYNKLNDMQGSLVKMHTQLTGILQCFSIQTRADARDMANIKVLGRED